MADSNCIDCGVALTGRETRRCRRCERALREDADREMEIDPLAGDDVGAK